MNQEQNQVKKTKSNVRRINIKEGQVIQIKFIKSNDLLSVAVDLDDKYWCVDYKYDDSCELGLAANATACRFIQSLLTSDEVQS